MMFKYDIFILLICKNASLISERFISKLFTSLKRKEVNDIIEPVYTPRNQIEKIIKPVNLSKICGGFD